jgi:hypothetical protein
VQTHNYLFSAKIVNPSLIFLADDIQGHSTS